MILLPIQLAHTRRVIMEKYLNRLIIAFTAHAHHIQLVYRVFYDILICIYVRYHNNLLGSFFLPRGGLQLTYTRRNDIK